jgi:hypothetical protein
MRRSDICLYLSPADRTELQALLSNRNAPRKLAWRADIVLATADGQGTPNFAHYTTLGAFGDFRAGADRRDGF